MLLISLMLLFHGPISNIIRWVLVLVSTLGYIPVVEYYPIWILPGSDPGSHEQRKHDRLPPLFAPAKSHHTCEGQELSEPRDHMGDSIIAQLSTGAHNP